MLLLLGQHSGVTVNFSGEEGSESGDGGRRRRRRGKVTKEKHDRGEEDVFSFHILKHVKSKGTEKRVQAL